MIDQIGPLDSIVAYIAADLEVGAVGTVVFLENMPDQPDTAVCVYDTGGAPPTLTQGDDTDQPSFQVVARSLSAGTARQTMQTIFQGLHGMTETTIHGTHVKLLYALQSNPISLGRDEKQRFSFSWNYRAMVAGVTR